MLKFRSAGSVLAGIVLVICLTLTATAQELTREIVVNIPEFTLYLYENGIVIKQYPIGVGTEVKPSVLGETEVINRVKNPTYYPIRWWERGLEPIPPGPDNPVGTRWIGLGIPSYGIHGTNNPASIGHPVSSGCIRMYNHDVEELMDLIRVGTKVTLIYQTIRLSQDPLLNTKTITVHPDIYKYNTNTTETVMIMLEERGWTDIHLEALGALLENPSGLPQPLPLAVDCVINGTRMEGAAVKFGRQYYVPLVDDLAEYQFEDVKLWDREYVNVTELAEKLGFGYQISDSIELFNVEFMLFEESTGVQAFLQDEQLFLPVEELSRALELPIPTSLAAHTEKINGVEYLRQADSFRWGLKVTWNYPERQAVIVLPLIYLDGEALGAAVIREDWIYVPYAEPVFELTAVAPDELSSLYGIETVQAGNTFYVPEWLIQWMLPGVELEIIYP